MRHNQNNNNRRFRGGGRNNNGGGGGQSHHQGGGGHSGGGNRRVNNPRVQTFDSNGPEVRIRGNALQITEKYLTLARDATAAGDRVLAESYFQHAEHYQRMLNEMNEEFNQYQKQFPQPQQQPQQQGGQQQQQEGQDVSEPSSEQPNVEMNDLDQGFLTAPRYTNTQTPRPEGEEQPTVQRPQRRTFDETPPKETEQV